MKTNAFPIVAMFMTIVMIFPVGMSYAAFPPDFTANPSSADTTSNQTSTNQTMSMSSDMNQTSANPAMNQTMTPTNTTSSEPAMNQTMTQDNTTSSQPAMNETMTPTNTTSSQPVATAPKIPTPLEQVKSGVAAKDVQCKTGFTLIFKTEDGSPACVEPNVAQILTERGW